MTIQAAFSQTTSRSGVAHSYEAGEIVLVGTHPPSLYQDLIDAVADLRTYWQQRADSKGLKAARAGVGAVLNHILHGGRFDSARDTLGLDAGYYCARACVPYDFIALGSVARCGVLTQVQPVRYYNQHVDGRAAFLAALEAGLRFSSCTDADGHDAGFFIAHSGDSELMEKYETAGGTYKARELQFLGRSAVRRTA